MTETFPPVIPPAPLARSLRSLSTLLESGVPIPKAFDTVAEKTPHAKARRALREIADGTRRGESVDDLVANPDLGFPPLVIEMIRVAEESGHHPEVLRGLAEHYENVLRLRRNFKAAIAWPCFQLVTSILIIALMIWILGWVGGGRGQKLDPLGFGLFGAKGAFLWLFLSFGTIAVIVLSIHFVRRGVAGRGALDGFFLRIPILGSCLQDFAVARFSWAFAVTQQTGMMTTRSLHTSLRATNNGAFQRAAPDVVARIKAGEPLTSTLTQSELFPIEFIEMLSVAEEAGSIPETLHRLSPQFEDQARRSLDRLVRGSGWLIWGIVATFIIVMIFRLALWYSNLLNNAAGI